MCDHGLSHHNEGESTDSALINCVPGPEGAEGAHRFFFDFFFDLFFFKVKVGGKVVKVSSTGTLKGIYSEPLWMMVVVKKPPLVLIDRTN